MNDTQKSAKGTTAWKNNHGRINHLEDTHEWLAA
jgi:hypothetical protein